MTRQEFSDTFTTLLNSYNTIAQFGEQASQREIVLDEYEKSVLLTQAQDLVVKSYFDGTLNQQAQGFDDSARRQVDFSSLVTVKTLSTSAATSKFDNRGIMFKLPLHVNVAGAEVQDTCDVLFMLNERLDCEAVTSATGPVFGPKRSFVVVPISYREYDREMSKPFAQPLKKQAWRLFQNDATGYDIDSELIVKQSIADKYKANPAAVGDIKITYKVRYVRRPKPIILEDMPNGLEIDGETNASDCELNPILHIDILNKAVELAIATRGGVQRQAQTQEAAGR